MNLVRKGKVLKPMPPENPQQQLSDARDAALLRALARGNSGAHPAADDNRVAVAPQMESAESALAKLYDIYGNILFGLLLRILHSRTEAEDVLQEVFVQVWQRASSFNAERGRPFTWLVTLARSRAIDRLRANASRERTAQAAGEANAPQSASEVVNPFFDMQRNEQRETIRAALDLIPEDQRRVILLAYFEGLTQTEIAERLREPLGTIKTRTRAAMFKLRDLLGKRISRAASD